MGSMVNQMVLDWLGKKRRNRIDINEGVAEYRRTPQAVLLDVREADEYRSGHIPGAVNMPLSGLQNSEVKDISIEKTAPIFVYCLRGSRSKTAVDIFARMGYQDVRSIGGINRYRGELVK